MNKVKALSFISIGLLVLNLLLIWFIFSHRPNHGGKEGPKKIIIEKLHFDESQTKAYEVLIDAHRKDIQRSETQMMALKNQLYGSLQTGKNTDASDSLILEIGRVQMEMEDINFNHFNEIKQLCKPDQLIYFDELCGEIASLFNHKPHPPLHEK